MRRSLVSRPGFSCRVTTHSTMRPTAGHEIPSSRLSVVRSVTRNPHRRAGYRRRRRIAAGAPPVEAGTNSPPRPRNPRETGGLLREPARSPERARCPLRAHLRPGSSPERSPARSCNCSMCLVGFALTWSSMPPVDSPRGDLRHTCRRPEAQNGCRLAKHPHNLSRHVAGPPNENDSESGCSFQQDDGPDGAHLIDRRPGPG